LRYLSKSRLEKGAIKEEKQRRPSLPKSLIDRYQFAKSEFSIVALKTSSTRSPSYRKFLDLPLRIDSMFGLQEIGLLVIFTGN